MERLPTVPCLLFALRRESAPFLKRWRPEQRIPGAPCPAFWCRRGESALLLLETGVGSQRTQRALAWLSTPLSRDGYTYPIDLLVAAGFAGGVDSRAQVGDALVADVILDEAGQRWTTSWPGEKPSLGAGVHSGGLLTCPRLIAAPEEKQRLATAHGVLAVDMESKVVARFAAQQGLAVGVVRAVSDDCRTALSPELVKLLSHERVSIPACLGALARRPQIAAEMYRLAASTRMAARRLAQVLDELLCREMHARPGAPSLR